MPVKIHHGPPGSYKTAGAMADDFLREAREGRVIVTNVRGVSKDRTLEQFPDLPESFDVIWVDDKSEEGRQKWATWFHWVPKGAFLFVDEAQDIWPKRWRDADIKALDYPGGLRQATKDDRPFCWDQAWEKHRHWNWDLVLTTPSYKKIRPDIKEVADAAYKHKDLALIGWMGNYIEAMHMADDEGKSQSDFLNVVRKKVPSYVFKLYDSTATGFFRITKNGFNLFASPRIVILLAVLALALYFGFGRGGVQLFSGAAKADASKAVPATSSSLASSSPSGAPSGGVVSRVGDDRRPSPADGLVAPFEGDDVYITASYKGQGGWRYSISFAGAVFTHSQIVDMGYRVFDYGSCGAELQWRLFKRFVTCGFPKDQRVKMDSPDMGAQPGQSRSSQDSFQLPKQPLPERVQSPGGPV